VYERNKNYFRRQTRNYVIGRISYLNHICLKQMHSNSFLIYNLNQQSEFTFYNLMLWLLQCLHGESPSGESQVPQIRSIGQFLLSCLFSSLTSSILRSEFSWVSSVVWCLLHFTVIKKSLYVCLRVRLTQALCAVGNLSCHIPSYSETVTGVFQKVLCSSIDCWHNSTSARGNQRVTAHFISITNGLVLWDKATSHLHEPEAFQWRADWNTLSARLVHFLQWIFLLLFRDPK
jgi:hypothetical protein